MVSSPAVVGNLVYVGSCSGTVLALDRRDGRVRWRRDVRPDGRPISFHGDPLVTDSLLVIGTDAGTEDREARVWAFTLDRGDVRWSHPVRRGIVSDIIGTVERVLAITRSDSLLCLDLATGRRLWSFAGKADTVPPAFRSPAVAGSRVFFGDQQGDVHALDLGSGRRLWTRRIGVPVESGILATGGELVLADAHGIVHRLDQASGAVRDSIDIGVALGGPPTPVGDSLVVLAGQNGIACVDLAASRVRWVQGFGLSSARPYLWRGALLAAAQNGELLALRVSDGATLWSRRPGGVVRGIGQDGETVYVGTQAGMIRAFVGDRLALPAR